MSTGDAETPSRFDPYGPNSDADATRQAQHAMSNDTPVLANINSLLHNSQLLTFDIAGKEFAANSDLRQKYADTKFGKMT